MEYLQWYSSFSLRNGTPEISLPFVKLSSFQSLISRKQLREIEVQMVSAISFGWFADFGKTLTNGRDPFDQNFRKFRCKIKWNRTVLEIRFENCGQPPEVVLFSGNLEIPEISCSIWHFYPVRIDPSSFSREKLQDGGE